MRRFSLVPAGLLLLSGVPVVSGGLRLAEFAGAAAVLPDSDRITSAPVPVVLHIVSVTVFSVLGALQFAPGLRRRRRWHRLAGRVVAPAGVVAALSGLWLTLFLPPAELDSGTLTGIRVVVAAGMAGSLVLGFAAARRRDFAGHRGWMTRGYALGLGAGTQAFTTAVWLAAVGPLTVTGRTVTLTAGWLINALVAEWAIRRGRRRPPGQPRWRRIRGSSAGSSTVRPSERTTRTIGTGRRARAHQAPPATAAAAMTANVTSSDIGFPP